MWLEAGKNAMNFKYEFHILFLKKSDLVNIVEFSTSRDRPIYYLKNNLASFLQVSTECH